MTGYGMAGFENDQTDNSGEVQIFLIQKFLDLSIPKVQPVFGQRTEHRTLAQST